MESLDCIRALLKVIEADTQIMLDCHMDAATLAPRNTLLAEAMNELHKAGIEVRLVLSDNL